MGAAEALGSGDVISLHDLRPLVGARVAAQTAGGAIEGTLLSCTARSLWLVANDADVVVPLDGIVSLHR